MRQVEAGYLEVPPMVLVSHPSIICQRRGQEEKLSGNWMLGSDDSVFTVKSKLYRVHASNQEQLLYFGVKLELQLKV